MKNLLLFRTLDASDWQIASATFGDISPRPSVKFDPSRPISRLGANCVISTESVTTGSVAEKACDMRAARLDRSQNMTSCGDRHT